MRELKILRRLRWNWLRYPVVDQWEPKNLALTCHCDISLHSITTKIYPGPQTLRGPILVNKRWIRYKTLNKVVIPYCLAIRYLFLS